ncbi:asparaginase [Allokutzneria sp. NRRL B-24872]|uniref:asparaginase n=1 Tax=Allokutzneria sp. NRRL B-24872 TaxID=1137961 RepID=UPI000A3999A9|nr:asparaginase [Allokutzneria sp. NRRL B-24872]
MERVVVIATGGTIASQPTMSGLAASLQGRSVISAVPPTAGLRVDVIDLCTIDSSCLTIRHQLDLLEQVRVALADPDVTGVVVTHGTDTLEESAFLLDLHHDDPRPVVLTGSQLPLGHEGSDAPRNLSDAFIVAQQARDLGVLVVFNGHVHAARGTVKRHTLDAHAFGDPSHEPLGRILGGELLLRRDVQRRSAPLPAPRGSAPRVDIVTHHSDGDAVLLRASIAAGARGIVLVGAGTGNATPEIAEAVRDATLAGVVVAVTSRCAAGPVAPVYASGGDLLAAGAILAGHLRASQTRIALLSALMHTDSPERCRALLPALLGT